MNERPWQALSTMLRQRLNDIHDHGRLCPISTSNRLISVETNMLDPVDRQIIHLMTIEPRASFRTIAEVTGISDQTAARRYRKLSESAGLRVLGVVTGARAGWVDWFLRLQTTPGSADAVAEALARRPDTRWVNLASGGTEIICTVQASSPEQRDALFLRGLPGSRRVVQISAHSILHNFTPMAWQGIRQALSAEQIAKLAQLTANAKLARHVPVALGPAGVLPGETASPGHEGDLLPEDEPLLAELGRDGRASHAALAATIHWHESTVRRRIEELRRNGLLHFEVDMDARRLGMKISALLWLKVEPSQLDAAGRALAGHFEVPFAAATTGPTNLVVTALFRDTQHLYEYLTGPLAALPGVSSVETAPIIRTLKRTGSVP
jgi:DNA-binding Lrp family transcriptional regulator